MKIFFYALGIFVTIFFSACERDTTVNTKEPFTEKEIPLHVKIHKIEAELKVIDTPDYLEEYIVTVINKGSNNNLGYAAGAMEGGYAHQSDAKDIARYSLSLSGKKSSDDSAGAKSALFYTSNCAGCHGNDGKGLNGAFPDLSLHVLKGIAKRKNYLLMQLQTLKQ